MAEMNLKEWILVANAAHARLLEKEPERPMKLVARFEHPKSRLRTSVLGDDKAGRELSDRSFGAAAFRPRTDAHRKEHLRFAHELATHLEREARRNTYAALAIFASSPFLGELKAELGDVTRSLLVATKDVDLCSVGLTELPRRIRYERSRKE